MGRKRFDQRLLAAMVFAYYSLIGGAAIAAATMALNGR
jgi:hypothetical protein